MFQGPLRLAVLERLPARLELRDEIELVLLRAGAQLFGGDRGRGDTFLRLLRRETKRVGLGSEALFEVAFEGGVELGELHLQHLPENLDGREARAGTRPACRGSRKTRNRAR